MTHEARCYIGLGANLGEAIDSLRAAVQALSKLQGTRLVAVSSLYRSAPVDSSGPDYFNAVAALDTTLAPQQLLASLQDIEAAHGRERPYRNAPRTLDLDVLLYDALVLNELGEPSLTVPHPRMHERAFVLQPLLELAPQLASPTVGRLAAHLPTLGHQAVEKLPTRVDVSVRAFEQSDFDELVAQWHTTNRASYTYVAEHQKHTLDDARAFFRHHVLAECSVWVAQALGDGALLGLIAVSPGWIRQCAVFAGQQRRGIGGLLLRQAQALQPQGLELFTFERNTAARAFYESHGFELVAHGVSPAPECEPDVRYRWSPARRST